MLSIDPKMIKIVDGLLAVPTVNDYFSALRKIEITELQTELLRIQYSASLHQIKAEDLGIVLEKYKILIPKFLYL
ncbi:hypothetical protein ACN4EE_20455 [Geminocystis sp. CENA526]|uniref:hypothetical protein n=1 Tax=Geminocystis sp. CENA526 TaxID=1355871 RepID=UPI003D701056